MNKISLEKAIVNKDILSGKDTISIVYSNDGELRTFVVRDVDCAACIYDLKNINTENKDELLRFLLRYDRDFVLSEKLSDHIEEGKFKCLTVSNEYGRSKYSFQGHPLPDNIVKLLIDIVSASDLDDSDKAIELFLTKLHNNVEPHIVEELLVFMSACYERYNSQIGITSDGRLVLYKGVVINSDGKFASKHSGVTFVNGTRIDGFPVYGIGDEVSLPREFVCQNSSIGCSTGLHCGTLVYARDWGSTVLQVAVDPADVCSVPSDCDFQKLRCCKFVPLQVIGNSTGDYFISVDEDDYDEDEYDEDDYDDEECDNQFIDLFIEVDK